VSPLAPHSPARLDSPLLAYPPRKQRSKPPEIGGGLFCPWPTQDVYCMDDALPVYNFILFLTFFGLLFQHGGA
jgi:hypothetical protein